MSNQHRKKYTEQDYINKCDELDLIYISNHKEIKKGTMIHFICKKHKTKGIQIKDWSHFRTYKYGCSYCSGRNKTTEEISNEIKDENVILISEYLGNEKPIKCKCKKCNNIWITLPKVLITNGSGCPRCGKEKAIKNESKTRKQFINELKKLNSDIEVLGNYINTHTKIKCKCTLCNTIWYAYPANLLNKSAGCPGYNISIGEKTLLNTLKELNISYIPQYTIPDCVHKRTLRFDAFDITHKIAFEYNGEQHYYPVDFAGKGTEWSNNTFKSTVERDNSKIEYCKKNSIPLIIVPYWERDNMKNIIKSKLKEMNIKIA